MTERSARANRFLFVGLLGALGAAGVIMALVGFNDFASALTRHDGVVAAFPYSSTILVISVFLLMTAGLSCLPAPGPPQGGTKAQAPKWVERLRVAWLISGAVCLIGAVFVRPVQHMVNDQTARDHGYIACPAITLRHDADRWALPSSDSPTGRCPS